MKTTCLSFLALLLTFTLSTSAWSQDRDIESVKYDFNEVEIDGHLKRPEGAYINAFKTSGKGHLITIRANFRKEIVSSAESE